MASENKIEPMDSKYDPNAIEQRIYSVWIENNYFAPDIDSDKEELYLNKSTIEKYHLICYINHFRYYYLLY